LSLFQSRACSAWNLLANLTQAYVTLLATQASPGHSSSVAAIPNQLSGTHATQSNDEIVAWHRVLMSPTPATRVARRRDEWGNDLPQSAEQSTPLAQMAIGQCHQAARCGGLLQRKQRQTQHVYTLFITPTAIFDTRSGSVKSGYRFVQTIYRLPDIV